MPASIPHFDAIAPSYDRHAAAQREVANRLLERLDGLRFQPERILDLGCATGHQARQLHQHFPAARVVAVDAAPGMLARARRQRGRWRRRFDLLAGQAEALPLAEASIDLVFASLSLEWCDQPEAVLHGLRRVMRPGGLLLIATTGPDTHRELDAFVNRQPGAIAGSQRIHAMQLGDALTRAGFREPVVDTDWLRTTAADPADLLDDLHCTGSMIDPSIDRAALARELAADDDNRGRCTLTWEIVYASAWAPEAGQPIRTAGGEEASVPVGSIPVRRRRPE